MIRFVRCKEVTAKDSIPFDEALARFTRRLQSLKAKPAARTRPPARAAGKTRGPAALLQKARTPRMKAMQAHISSRGRRSQARRDSR